MKLTAWLEEVNPSCLPAFFNWRKVASLRDSRNDPFGEALIEDEVLQEVKEWRIQEKREHSPGRPRTIDVDFLQQLVC